MAKVEAWRKREDQESMFAFVAEGVDVFGVLMETNLLVPSLLFQVKDPFHFGKLPMRKNRAAVMNQSKSRDTKRQ